MSEKDLMGSLSPAYGMMSGRGAFGKLADSGLGGIIPSLMAQRRRKKDGTEMTAAEEASLPAQEEEKTSTAMKKGGSVKKYKKGGTVSSASKRADGCAVKGKTKGRFV